MQGSRLRRAPVLLAALVAVVALLAACGPDPAPPPPPDPLTPVSTARDLAVDTETFTFVDESRETPAYGSYPGAPERTIPTQVWYPADRDGPYPLVVFAHGFGVTPDVLAEFEGLGIDCYTTGNHVWDKKEGVEILDRHPRLLRPANYPEGNPGRGLHLGEIALRLHFFRDIDAGIAQTRDHIP